MLDLLFSIVFYLSWLGPKGIEIYQEVLYNISYIVTYKICKAHIIAATE